MSSAFGGGYSNPSLGLMDRVKNFFDGRDAQRAENETHRKSTEHLAMQHQMALEQMHARHEYDKDMVKTTGRVTRKNTSHAATVSGAMPAGSSMSATPEMINVTAPPAAARKTRSTTAKPAAAKPAAAKPAAAKPAAAKPTAAKPATKATKTPRPPKAPATPKGPKP